MHHLSLLGEILVALGENPFYQNSNQICWSAQNINYEFCNVKEAMHMNAQSEQMAINSYRKLMKYTNNPYLRKVYERIILDEVTHIKIFEKIMEEC